MLDAVAHHGLGLLMGLACLVAGAVIGVRTWRFRQSARSVTGTVRDLRHNPGEWRGNTRWGDTYSPIVVWHDDRGAAHEFTSKVSSSAKVGDQVPVLFTPGRPETARLGKAKDLFFLTYFLIPMGLFLIGTILHDILR